VREKEGRRQATGRCWQLSDRRAVLGGEGWGRLSQVSWWSGRWDLRGKK
jgi:hypothetical protein